MRNAGYADTQWTMVVQTYPSPIPNGSGFRYGQSGYTRQSTGGCGFWNADADWANGYALPTINNTVTGAIGQAGIGNAKVLNLPTPSRPAAVRVGRRAVRGGRHRQLADGGRGRQDRVGQPDPHRLDLLLNSPYYIQESLHPNYWGQLAVRSCVRQAYNSGTPKGGTCTRTGTGLLNGEPRMTLQ